MKIKFDKEWREHRFHMIPFKVPFYDGKVWFWFVWEIYIND